MKNILLLVTVLSLTISCTTDETNKSSILSTELIENKSEIRTQRIQDVGPENPVNLYDMAGKIHNDILDTYLSNTNYTVSLQQICQKVDSISGLNTDLLTLEPNNTLNFEEIQQTIDNPETILEQAIADSPMTNPAKICLFNFLNSLLVWQNNDYFVIHQSIISFELSVISNPAFSPEEKRIILTTSSISRYSNYYERKRKDKDWETSVASRAAAVQGANDNCSTAINKSIVTGLLVYHLQNQ